MADYYYDGIEWEIQLVCDEYLYRDQSGWMTCSLHHYIEQDDFEALVAYVDSRWDRDGNTLYEREHLLAFAAYHGRDRIVQYLVEKGADIDNKALACAARAGHISIVRYLVERGAKFGNAVSQAVTGGHIDVVRYLLDQGAPLSKWDLHSAARANSLELVQLLLGYGVDPDLIDCYGNTARSIAIRLGNQAIADAIDEAVWRRHNHGFKRAMDGDHYVGQPAKIQRPDSASNDTEAMDLSDDDDED